MNARPIHRRATSPLLALVLPALLLLAVGCDGGSSAAPSTGEIGLSPPAALMQSRAVDRERLEPRVMIVGGPSVTMTPDGDGRWRGTIGVAPGRDYTLRISWVESVVRGERTRELELARLERVVSVGAEGAVVTISSEDYELDLDFDGDSVSNLAEREADTDPFGDALVPADGVFVPVPVIGTPGGSETPPGPPDEGSPVVTPPVVTPPVVTPPVVTPPVERPPVVEPPVVTPPRGTDADVVIPRIAPADAPRLDGRRVVVDENGLWAGEWAAATAFDTAGRRLFVDHLMIDGGTDESDGQAFRAWGAVHDGEYLYVLVVVEDAGARVRDSVALWNDDSLELYVDGDNSKRSSYGDGDDASRLLPLIAPDKPNQGVTDGIVSGFLSVDVPIRIDFATGPGRGPDGLRDPRASQDVYELRVALDSAGIVPGRAFGFELQVNDDDDGGERDAKWGWAHPSRDGEDIDFTYLDPSFMGTAILE